MKAFSFLVIMCMMSVSAFTQESTKTLEIQTQEIKSIQTLDSLSATNIVVFSNDKCGRCHTLMQMLDEKGLKYLEYDLGIEANRKVMYEAATRSAGASNISVAYPVVVFRDMTLYGQESLAEFVVKLVEAHQP
ncbi:MAG: hypothetical protein Q7J34_06265 [Bacteroidales bacterium]|nr:hypothetical protein [Bacteroidales bacterium]